MAVTNEVVYRDFDIRFLAHPITGKLNVKKNNEAIKQAFKLLILTNLFERPYRSTLGSGIMGSLFENYTAFTESDIRHAIETAVKNWESQRVELNDIRFSGDPDKNELVITIIFRPLNTVEVIDLVINLSRVR